MDYGEQDAEMKFLKTDILIVALIWFVIFLAYLMTTGCVTAPTDEDTKDKTYLHDLKVEVNGEKFVGIGVANLSTRYGIEISPDDQIDWVLWGTVHQEHPDRKPNTGWFNKKYDFQYYPKKGFEDSTASPLHIWILNKSNRKAGFALVDFVDARPEIQLPAVLSCNGEVFNCKKNEKQCKAGVSICQSAQGLVQQIDFETEVIHTEVDGPCKVMPIEKGKSFRFEVAGGECAYYFTSNIKTADGKRLSHRLTTIGYTEVPSL